jgi:hypothetical protein
MPRIAITGASSGIGEATAVLFAERGWTVDAGARRFDRLEKLAAKYKTLRPLRLDVTDAESVARFAEAVGAPDVLVNNAGGALGLDRLDRGDFEDWRGMIESNVLGLLRVTRDVLPAMIGRGSGHVVNMGSVAGEQVYEGGGVYCAAKHAVRAITKTLRLELNGTPIRVTELLPGMVETEFALVRLRDAGKAKNVYRGMTPLVARDIAECVWFAVSRPPHVTIEEMVIMPTDQATVYRVHRREST